MDESLPDIVGSITASTSYIFHRRGANGVFTITGKDGVGPQASSNNDGNNVVTFRASSAVPVYKENSRVRPQSLITQFYIRF